MACSLARFCSQVILKRSEAHSEVTVLAARLVAPNVGWIARHLLSRGVLEGDRRDQSWILEVLDQGQGIAAGDLPHVFDRFYRAESARALPGSGLGLWIAHAFVTACGGDIEAMSDGIARGSKVSIRLAAARETPQESAREIYG